MPTYKVSWQDERVASWTEHDVEAFFPSDAAKKFGENYDFGFGIEKVECEVTEPDGTKTSWTIHIQRHVYVRPQATAAEIEMMSPASSAETVVFSETEPAPPAETEKR